MRFADGRSLREVIEQKRLEKEAEEEEARLKALEDEAEAESEEKFVESEADSFLSDEMKSGQAREGSRGGIRFGGDEQPEEDDLGQNLNDPMLMDDLLKAKDELQRKREAFIASMDDGLTAEEKATLLAKFDDQMREMERSLLKEQEAQD